MPLKNLHKIQAKYSDKIQILAFAFASVFKHLLGNATRELSKYGKKCRWACTLYKAARNGLLAETFHDERSAALYLENKFGSLRFVSCGSRGLESLRLEQFVAVFEITLWKWILGVEVLLIVSMNLIRGSMLPLNLLDKAVCIIKVLLEQGDPFPGRFVKSKAFRFIISGTLLGGLVLSNAFKSTNVYNIVLPKQHLKFRTFQELLQHGYSVYSKFGVAQYFILSTKNILLPTKAVSSDPFLFVYNSDDELISMTISDIGSYSSMNMDLPVKLIEKDLNLLASLYVTTRLHLGTHKTIMQPVEILRPLFQVARITLDNFQKAVETVDFVKEQKKLIGDDLRKCNKTAWVLPDYQAQEYARMLYQSGKHTDVGVDRYFKTNFNLVLQGPIPSPIIKRTSLVSSSGLLGWWSDLINRTDLVMRRDTEPPVKPAMSGNIQVLFIILGIGMLTAQIAMIIELHECIFKLLCAICHFIWLLMYGLRRKVKKIFEFILKQERRLENID